MSSLGLEEEGNEAVESKGVRFRVLLASCSTHGMLRDKIIAFHIIPHEMLLTIINSNTKVKNSDD